MRAHANELIATGKKLLEEVKAAEKAYAKQVKRADQGNKKRRRTSDDSASRTNSVFMQPKKISPELAAFCGVSADTLVCRTDATRKIGAYVKEHNLQNPENRREINADAKLTKLFGLTSADKLTYFNLQRYLKPHFPKA
jgi:chromatin remodeling complex protein RSC6